MTKRTCVCGQTIGTRFFFYKLRALPRGVIAQKKELDGREKRVRYK